MWILSLYVTLLLSITNYNFIFPPSLPHVAFKFILKVHLHLRALLTQNNLKNIKQPAPLFD